MSIDNAIIITRFILGLILIMCMWYSAEKGNTAKVILFGIAYLAISLEGKVILISNQLDLIINLLK